MVRMIAMPLLFCVSPSVFLSALVSVECRRGGILGRNGQRSHRLVPLGLRRRGAKRQSVRYSITKFTA